MCKERAIKEPDGLPADVSETLDAAGITNIKFREPK
jgi:hypothetical protein